jgi:hypothetical protein
MATDVQNPELAAPPGFSSLVTCTRTVAVVELDRPVQHNTTGHAGTFLVTNTSSTSNAAAVTCTGYGTITCTGVAPSTLTLAPGQSGSVGITFSAGAPSKVSGVRVGSCGGLTSPKIVVE